MSNEFEAMLKSNKAAADYFYSQAPYYKKTAIHWVMSAKQEKTRLRRINNLISDSEQKQKVKPFRN